jgi:hypothetical protein
MRCSTKEDTSLNCGSPEELVNKIKQIFLDGKYEHKKTYNEPSLMFHRESNPKQIDPKDPPKIVYISTNEANKTVLDVFKSAGYVTFRDIPFNQTFNSLDQFIIELQMMIDTDYYLAWGVSSIHDFVRAADTRHGAELERRLHPERSRMNTLLYYIYVQ